MPKLRVLIRYEHGNDATPFGAAYIRLIRPLSHPTIRRNYKIWLGDRKSCRGMDVVIADRMWKPGVTTSDAEQLVEEVRQAGARLVFAIDDNLIDHPGVGTEQKAVVELLARESDGVIVSTGPLRDRFLSLNETVELVPNAVDERLFRRALRRRPPKGRDPSVHVIGYMGTFTHDGDLRMIAPALRAAWKKHRSRIELHVVGAIGSATTYEALGDIPVRVVPLRPKDMEYPRFVRWMVANMHFDIGIAPLEDSAFTRCKSDMKYLDYGALGIPGIFSRVPAYEHTVQHLRTGYLAENNAQAWEEGLNRLLDDSQLRQSMGRQVQSEVFATRTLEHCAWRWDSAIQTIVEKRRCRQQ